MIGVSVLGLKKVKTPDQLHRSGSGWVVHRLFRRGILKLGAEYMQGSLARLVSNYWLAMGVVLYLLFIGVLHHGSFPRRTHRSLPFGFVGLSVYHSLGAPLFSRAFYQGENLRFASHHLWRSANQLR